MARCHPGEHERYRRCGKLVGDLAQRSMQMRPICPVHQTLKALLIWRSSSAVTCHVLSVGVRSVAEFRYVHPWRRNPGGMRRSQNSTSESLSVRVLPFGFIPEAPEAASSGLLGPLMHHDTIGARRYLPITNCATQTCSPFQNRNQRPSLGAVFIGCQSTGGSEAYELSAVSICLRTVSIDRVFPSRMLSAIVAIASRKVLVALVVVWGSMLIPEAPAAASSGLLGLLIPQDALGARSTFPLRTARRPHARRSRTGTDDRREAQSRLDASRFQRNLRPLGKRKWQGHTAANALCCPDLPCLRRPTGPSAEWLHAQERRHRVQPPGLSVRSRGRLRSVHRPQGELRPVLSCSYRSLLLRFLIAFHATSAFAL